MPVHHGGARGVGTETAEFRGFPTRHARDAGPICPPAGSHVTYYLFAPQGSGEAESLTPLKRRTTPDPNDTHLECSPPTGLGWGPPTTPRVSEILGVRYVRCR